MTMTHKAMIQPMISPNHGYGLHLDYEIMMQILNRFIAFGFTYLSYLEQSPRHSRRRIIAATCNNLLIVTAATESLDDAR